MADNRGVNKNMQAFVKSIAPDVCWTPRGKKMQKVAYDIISRFDVAQQTTDTVKFGGDPVFNMGSRLPTVAGDEPGTGGGAARHLQPPTWDHGLPCHIRVQEVDGRKQVGFDQGDHSE